MPLVCACAASSSHGVKQDVLEKILPSASKLSEQVVASREWLVSREGF